MLRLQKNGKWGTLEFKRGRTSIEDDPSSGRPKSATKMGLLKKIAKGVGRPQIEEWMTLLKSYSSHMSAVSYTHLNILVRRVRRNII